jgi:hypothetical protein
MGLFTGTPHVRVGSYLDKGGIDCILSYYDRDLIMTPKSIPSLNSGSWSKAVVHY